jgi:hypothetical protein
MVGMEMERKGWRKWRVEEWGVLGYYRRPTIRRIQEWVIVEARLQSWSIHVVVVMERGIPRVRVICG